jgi:uncharacterized membrane protein
MAKVPPTSPSREPDDPVENAGTALTRANEIRERVQETIGPLVQGQARVQVVERVTQMMSAEIFRGPLPHPKHIQAYEDACPGAADRIIRMAEIAQQRREDRRDVVIANEYADRRLGMLLGFGALVAMIVGGVLLVYHGESEIGTGLLGAGVLGTVVGSFIHGRRQQEPETKTQTDSPKGASVDKQ